MVALAPIPVHLPFVTYRERLARSLKLSLWPSGKDCTTPALKVENGECEPCWEYVSGYLLCDQSNIHDCSFQDQVSISLTTILGILKSWRVLMKKWKARLVRKDIAETSKESTTQSATFRTAADENIPNRSIFTRTSSIEYGPKDECLVPPETNLDISRSETQRSDISRFNAPLTVTAQKHARQRSVDRRNDPLGLSLLYTPSNDEPTADIIFVHGLGGTSRLTWAYNRDEDLFWPQLWLPTEPDICTARILTYGYNAYFASQGPNSIAGISDFAKQLLFDMKFGKDGLGEDLGVGQRPIIFVVHSMGGLVFKKAVLQGHNDDEFKEPVSQVKAVLFLATPHRGSNLAEVLNRILSVSIFNHTPKQYLNELKENSPFIEDVNEEFRKHASRMQIFSFYETLETSVGSKNFKVMVVQKSSSTLGYPQEITEPLNADHNTVCKYPNRLDPSYRSVRGVIKTLVSTYRKAKEGLQQAQSSVENEKLLKLLGSFPNPKDDYTSILQLWRRGTCHGFLSDKVISGWRDDAFGSKILWVYAQPGSGKSVKSAVYIQDLKEKGLRCVYYFFKFGDARKRSPGSLLQSLVYQIAQELPAFRHALATMKNNGVSIDKMAPRMIWDKIFTGILFKIESDQPMYVIIDALDESDSINTIVGFFGGIEISRTPLRILVTSRKTPDITTAFSRISPASLVDRLSLSDNLSDIELYAESEMAYMHGDPQFRQDVVKKITSRAEGNFLWVSLAVKEILGCHSPEDIAQILHEMPPGMESLYGRMESSIARLTRASDLVIAKSILSWATYCRRPLKVDELARALQGHIPQIIDLRHTVAQLCGHFVVVDSNDFIVLVHKTAREYLIKSANLPFAFDSEHIHETLFQQSIAIFLEHHSRQQLSAKERLIIKDLPPFVIYAGTSWSYHLGRSSPASDATLTLIVQFLKSSSVLIWIRIMASLRQLRILIVASSALRKFVSSRRRLDSATHPSQHRITDLEITEQWATDLLKIVGKFSSHLVDDPAAIQKLVPQFCPNKSAIYRKFSKQTQLSVKNITNDDWDDSLGRVSIGSNQHAMHITCSTRHLAVLTTNGKILLWDCETLEAVPSLNHDEFTFSICFNSTGELLASYGYLTTKIWNVTSRKPVYSIPNISETRALCMTFSQDDNKIIVGLDSRNVASADYKKLREWIVINSGFLEEDENGAYLNAPMTMAFSPNCAFVAVGYRGSAMEVWDMFERSRVSKCKRRPEYEIGNLEDWTPVMKSVWHPSGEAVLGVYYDGAVFKWNPFEEYDHEELATDLYSCPSEIRCSPDGILFLLSDEDGSVRIYNYEHFSLIYKLSSEDVITDLCFSMDSRRFYDLRGSYCNIWEPNALFRLPDSNDQGSEGDTRASSVDLSNHASESFTDMPVRITALATRPFGGLFFYGNEDGLVEANDASTLKAQSAGKTKGEGAVESIVWSDDGNYVAYTEADSVTVKKITTPHGRTNLTSQTVLNLDLDLDGGKIHQILLHSQAEYILIADATSVTIYDLSTKKVSAYLKSASGQKWANHPSDASQVLAFDVKNVSSYSWKSLETVINWDFNEPDVSLSTNVDEELHIPPSPAHGEASPGSNLGMRFQDYVDEILFSTTRKNLILSISQDGSYQKRWADTKIIAMSDLQDPDALTITPLSIHQRVNKIMTRPLGIIGKDRLVFIDRGFWVCSWLIGSGDDDVQRHFFLPREWVSLEMLSLCTVMKDGTILAPRKGEVAVIRSSLCSRR
ncbi:hypothetical protein AJ79_03146 [Helicocarpus griseus UAMH5409]|uniref:GPI inositol-deacylase n=1 Tax=Helicocarpus griseus UAMH5409 TaxID=1447875 RepID=A0A2B7XRD2_9EURO|nr:hypothetical protein AJ79_03146 [Helicocarpus griseus UAMH5409]